jgi:hypothetical protein
MLIVFPGKARVILALTFGASTLALPSSALATDYTFVSKADNTGPLGPPSSVSPSVSNSGIVAFRNNPDAGGVGIYSGHGTTVTTVAHSSGPYGGFDWPTSVNSSGTVAFNADIDAGGNGMFVGSGGAITPIATSAGPLNLFSGPSINDAGTVAFTAGRDAGGTGVYKGNGGAITTIVDTTGPLSGFHSPNIDSTGNVTVSGFFDAGGMGIFRGNGGPVTTLLDTSGPFSSFGPKVSATDDGRVAFVANLDAGGSGVFVTDSSGTPIPIADTSGPFNSFGDPGFSDDGTVAFQASLDNFGGSGIYTYRDGVLEVAIQSGMPMFGSTLSGFGFGAINDQGEIAFAYVLQNSVQGMALAVPVPEPVTLGLVPMLGLLLRRRRRR